MAKRGQITQHINAKAKELLGKEISQAELRLMPYAQYCIVNGKNIEPNKINAEEREILSAWRNMGWISGGAADFCMTKGFWDAIHEILWLGYAIHEEQPDE